MLSASPITWLERQGSAVSLAGLIQAKERVCNVANIKSQKKRILTNAKAAERNKAVKSELKTLKKQRWAEEAKIEARSKAPRWLGTRTLTQELAQVIAGAVGLPDLVETVRAAARLSKADLTTRMVKEFTDLQGVVGGIYARREGQPDSVWKAIYDQYRPQGATDDPPRDDTGAVLSLADRFDTVTGARSGAPTRCGETIRRRAVSGWSAARAVRFSSRACSGASTPNASGSSPKAKVT